MPLYEIVKSDGTREKVTADECDIWAGRVRLGDYEEGQYEKIILQPGTWLEVWRREGVGE